MGGQEPKPALPDADQLPYRYPAYAAFSPALSGDVDEDRLRFEALDAALDAMGVPGRARARGAARVREHVAGVGPLAVVAVLTVFIPLIVVGLSSAKAEIGPLLYTLALSAALNVPSPLMWAMRSMERMIGPKD